MKKRIVLSYMITAFAVAVLLFVSMNLGGIKTTVPQLLKGMFVEYDKDVAVIFELRVPRIVIALLGGAVMAVSGVCMQAVMRNPLADRSLVD